MSLEAGSLAWPGDASLVERLRSIHLRMVDAVLGGEGLGRVAQIAARSAGGDERAVRHITLVAQDDGPRDFSNSGFLGIINMKLDGCRRGE